MFIPFRPHPTPYIHGVLAKFANGISVLLESDKDTYEVLDAEGEIHYFDTVEELTKYLVEKGCSEERES